MPIRGWTHESGIAKGSVITSYSIHYTKLYDPYTRGLLDSIPEIDGVPRTRLNSITGSVPAPWDLPKGCRFHPRCPFATAKCATEAPSMYVDGNRRSACWHQDHWLDGLKENDERASFDIKGDKI